MAYIEREALKAAFLKYPRGNSVFDDLRVQGMAMGIDLALRKLNDAPAADVVPVVRCRECKYRFYDDELNRLWCDRASGCFEISDDAFCSYGEKRED